MSFTLSTFLLDTLLNPIISIVVSALLAGCAMYGSAWTQSLASSLALCLAGIVSLIGSWLALMQFVVINLTSVLLPWEATPAALPAWQRKIYEFWTQVPFSFYLLIAMIVVGFNLYLLICKVLSHKKYPYFVQQTFVFAATTVFFVGITSILLRFTYWAGIAWLRWTMPLTYVHVWLPAIFFLLCLSGLFFAQHKLLTVKVSSLPA